MFLPTTLFYIILLQIAMNWQEKRLFCNKASWRLKNAEANAIYFLYHVVESPMKNMTCKL